MSFPSECSSSAATSTQDSDDYLGLAATTGLAQPQSARSPTCTSSIASIPSTTSIGSATSDGLLQSALPPEIEEQFARMEHHLLALGKTLYVMKELCPLIGLTPPIQALADRIEGSRANMRDDLRSMHDRLSIPFTIFEPKFQNEEMEDLEFSVLRARWKGGPSFLRATVPRGPRLRRHGPGQLPREFPFALDVRYVAESDYESWHIPYKVIFTPDEALMDSNGDPFPSVAVDVDENGMAKCTWKKGAWDHEKTRASHLEEEVANPESERVPARAVTWCAKMVLEKRIRSRGDSAASHTVENSTQRALGKSRESSAELRSLAAASRPSSWSHDASPAPAVIQSGHSPVNIARREPRKRSRTTGDNEPRSGALPPSKKQRVSGVTC
ncbi:hypothetical protein BU15DRAFT_73694 [Melanogaster broomeanus]|nr:hypothetical protein BU15DRAFT_73694 [Melanogaster broomeanus]